MQERARRRERQALAADRAGTRSSRSRAQVEVGGPDVAAVDHAGGQAGTVRQRLQHAVELGRPPDEVDVQLGERQLRHAHAARGVELSEVGREADPDGAAPQSCP